MEILIVDDSKFSQMILAKHLKEAFKDIIITFAKDGEEGFEKYKKIQPNYVFIDLLMPNINGKELIKLIKTYDENAKIFVVSADVQNSVKKEVGEYGILEFFNKPFNEESASIAYKIIKEDYYGHQ